MVLSNILTRLTCIHYRPTKQRLGHFGLLAMAYIDIAIIYHLCIVRFLEHFYLSLHLNKFEILKSLKSLNMTTIPTSNVEFNLTTSDPLSSGSESASCLSSIAVFCSLDLSIYNVENRRCYFVTFTISIFRYNHFLSLQGRSGAACPLFEHKK